MRDVVVLTFVNWQDVGVDGSSEVAFKVKPEAHVCTINNTNF